MRGTRRLLCLLLAALLLTAFPAPSALAVETAVFTAVNDTLLPLTEETMPFGSGGQLYVASAAFDGSDLGIYYNRSRDKTTAVLYKQRNVMIYDLAAGTIETNNGQSFSGSAIVRGDVVFLPLEAVCRYFGLEYSLTRVSNGYLLRIKSDSVVLTDAKFIDAANATMASRYARFQRTQEEPEIPENPAEEPPAPRETAQRTVYFVVECTDPEKTEPMLSRFGGGQATYLFTPDGFDGADGLLRHIASGGGTAALRIDATGGAESTIAQIEAGNRALWSAANIKTRLVWLDGAQEETTRRVTEEGYCPIRAALDLSEVRVSVSRMSARILAAADARRGRCCVFLGTDEAVSGNLSALLVSLNAENCTSARLNEVTVSQK